MECELCRILNNELITKKYYEDNECIIVDCAECNQPMLIYKLHVPDVPVYKYIELSRKLQEVCGKGIISGKKAKLLSHLHIHLIRT